MNIGKAKNEIKNTINAYLSKDEMGQYRIPVEKQRPVLLMGPPGIGKTAIMEQIADEMGINLVSYTITHHTRQSAIGLPYISKKDYGGQEYSVTEYTMSEIIASIYDQIEKSGISEGILFLDEINCVSETLAPTMLQFLQYKTFGSHKVPEGFVIVTAGNPAEYNRSVRDFDIVTLDRVKKITIEADIDSWKNYAYDAGVHGAIMSYLSIKPRNFYSIRTEIEARYFVTARGWEDLSRLIKVYEAQGTAVDREVIVQYIQDPEIAGDFTDYYLLYEKYKNNYKLDNILSGIYPEDTEALARAPFGERLSVIGLMTDSLNGEFYEYAVEKKTQEQLMESLKAVITDIRRAEQCDQAQAALYIQNETDMAERMLRTKKNSNMLNFFDERCMLKRIAALRELKAMVAQLSGCDSKVCITEIKSWFASREASRQEKMAKTNAGLDAAFGFISRVYGESQEMVIFITELSSGRYATGFIADVGNENYYKFNKMLLLDARREDLRARVLELA